VHGCDLPLLSSASIAHMYPKGEERWSPSRAAPGVLPLRHEQARAGAPAPGGQATRGEKRIDVTVDWAY
jgi:hypothetical protein